MNLAHMSWFNLSVGKEQNGRNGEINSCGGGREGSHLLRAQQPRVEGIPEGPHGEAGDGAHKAGFGAREDHDDAHHHHIVASP